MAEKYLIDTSIWVDLYEDRKSYQNEPLGDFAFKLFSMIKAKQNKIVITDLTIRELETNYSMEEINGMMKLFEDILEKLVASKEQRYEAKKLADEKKSLKEMPCMQLSLEIISLFWYQEISILEN